jgi:hypothetical protein
MISPHTSPSPLWADLTAYSWATQPTGHVTRDFKMSADLKVNPYAYIKIASWIAEDAFDILVTNRN